MSVGVDVLVGVAVRVGVDVAVLVAVGVRVGVRVGVGVKVASGPGRLVLVGLITRMVAVAVAVGSSVAPGGTVFVKDGVNRKNGLAVGERVMVADGGMGVNVGVKTSRANSALVSALSVLIVGVGPKTARFGSYNASLPPPVIMTGRPTPTIIAAKAASRNTTFCPFIAALSFHGFVLRKATAPVLSHFCLCYDNGKLSHTFQN